MGAVHHDLISELPEYKEKIHEMKMNNAHFARLFEEYHELTTQIELMEGEVEPVSSSTEEEHKKRRLALKDELFAMLQAD